MKICTDCLYQGDINADPKGKIRVFCLLKGDWKGEKDTCGRFRENADIGKEIRNRLAFDIRQEDLENKRINKIVQSNMKFVVFIMIVSFALFWCTVKFFDKYIF